MDKQPTEARQDELVRQQIHAVVSQTCRNCDYWDGENYHCMLNVPIHPSYPCRIADQILSLTVSSGGTCPECKGEGEIFHRGVIDTLKAWSRCTTCNGTGQEPIVTKTLREIIKEALEC